MVEKKQHWIKKWLRREYAIFALAVTFIVSIHRQALEERFLFTLYFIATAFAACALVRRRAFGLAATTVAITGAMLFVSAYYAAKPDYWVPWIDPIRDIGALGLLIFLTVQVLVELYRFQKEEREREFKQIIEKQTVETRAAALRSTSHEVRTPLTTITAITETLLDQSAGELTDVQRDFVNDIDDAARHLLALINDILDYAKAEAGMIRLAPQRIDLVELIQQCVTIIDPKAQEAGVSISVQVDPSLTAIVADPLRLKQILLNLLTNAVKYNRRDGSIAVRVQPTGEDNVQFSVRDTGRGIQPEHMGRLFDPYYQAAVADQGIGTGLGLAIIKHLAETHGGNVSVESTPGVGSLFTVKLPRVASCDDVHNEALESAHDAGSPEKQTAELAL